jgi:hypothetical protein
MTLIQTGSALDGRGITQLVYSCDGCKTKTGDPYAHIAFVHVTEGEWDDSEVEGWLVDESGEYCAECAKERAS